MIHHGNLTITAANAHDFASLTSVGGRLWDNTTPYGQARWELLDFLIGEL